MLRHIRIRKYQSSSSVRQILIADMVMPHDISIDGRGLSQGRPIRGKRGVFQPKCWIDGTFCPPPNNMDLGEKIRRRRGRFRKYWGTFLKKYIVTIQYKSILGSFEKKNFLVNRPKTASKGVKICFCP